MGVMDVAWARKQCLGLGPVTEQIQWGNDLVFKVGGKMFAVAALEPGAHWLAFKCRPEVFAELVEREGIIPAPYLARAHWVALETKDAVRLAELVALLREAYELVLAKLPRKVRAGLEEKPRIHTDSRSAHTRG
jgi:predicted DNA-binding protein (MmcQ/YjbR family)